MYTSIVDLTVNAAIFGFVGYLFMIFGFRLNRNTCVIRTHDHNIIEVLEFISLIDPIMLIHVFLNFLVKT